MFQDEIEEFKQVCIECGRQMEKGDPRSWHKLLDQVNRIQYRLSEDIDYRIREESEQHDAD